MKLKFSVEYNTAWGEAIHVDLSYIFSDGSLRHYNIPMNTSDGSTWTVETVAMESRQRSIKAFKYAYQLENGAGELLHREWDLIPRIVPCNTSHDYVMNDTWRVVTLMNHLYSDAYKVTKGQELSDIIQPLPLPLFRKTAMFRVSAPQIRDGQAVAICGSHPAMGDWNTSRYLPMQYAGGKVWMLTVNVEAMLVPLEYKYVIVDSETHDFVEWEEGDNRTVSFTDMPDGQILLLDGGNLRVREDLWKVAGVVVPVFSLRSLHSTGVGDFGDLKRFVDWAFVSGMKVIQILPVNDTTMQHNWSDSYPYNTISVNALHPQYVDLEAAGALSDKNKMTEFNRRRLELNNLPYTDYVAVERVKGEYLHLLFSEIKSDCNIEKFKEDNADWLIPYATFCILRDKFSTARFTDWGEYSTYDRHKALSVCKDNASEAEYIFFVQYLLHKQLTEAAAYAREHGIVLMGDLPIGVSHDSADAWSEGNLFNMDCQTGSLPDNANPYGQNWCFPTYNWEALKADDYKWWRKRLSHMEKYFGAIRIDHVLGFFRIWEIPDDATDGILGHFSPSQPFTQDDIEYYGLTFRKDLFTKPFINDKVLNRIFGIHAQYVKENYLVPKAYNLYGMKAEFATQKMIRERFGDCNDENSLWIRDGLCRLITDVLFIEDHRMSGMYHPRVWAYKEPIYDALTSEDRAAFMRIYNEYYYERHNELWKSTAMRRLPAVFHNNNMLICAEDLGQLPDCVGYVLDALRMLTLEVQMLPKQSGLEFAHLDANPYLSVATITTHDMAPLRLWWEENHSSAQRYYTTMLQKQGRVPEHITTVLAEEIIGRHLYCPSMICNISLQDLLAMDQNLSSKFPRQERINTPGDCYNRWQYRMSVNIEQLLTEDRFNKKLRTMIERSKRL